MSKNPFYFGKIVEKENFYNRREEIEEAIGYLRNLQNFSIIGEECIGKSSFLSHVLSREILKEHGIDSEKYIIVHIEMGSLPEITRNALIDAIIAKISKQTHIEIKSKNLLDKLKIYVEKLALNGKNLVIALDEFEAIEHILDNDFSRWLKFIFQKPSVIAITASHKPMGNIKRPEIGYSPLSSIFSNITLGLFGRGETESIITEMFRKGGIELEQEEIAFLADLSGGNPYLIQFLGNYFYKEKKKEKNRKISLLKFKNRMLFYARSQFESYWRNLEDEAKDYLKEVRMRNKSSNPPIEHNLKERGFLKEENGSVYLFSELFCYFVDEKIRLDKMPNYLRIVHFLKKIWRNRRVRLLTIFLLFVSSIILLFRFHESDLVILISLVIMGSSVTTLIEFFLRE